MPERRVCFAARQIMLQVRNEKLWLHETQSLVSTAIIATVLEENVAYARSSITDETIFTHYVRSCGQWLIAESVLTRINIELSEG